MSNSILPSDPRALRQLIREGLYTGPTRGLAPGRIQCNLVVLRQSHAADFLLYCQRNSKACPLIEATGPGDPEPRCSAAGADLRTDLPRYNVFRNGRCEAEPKDIISLWEPDHVAFLLGSGMSSDDALQRAGIPTDSHRWVLRSAVPTEPAGPFRGNLIVTMRWLTSRQAIQAVRITARYPLHHGAPFHIGDPAAIGADLQAPLFGGPVPEKPRDQIALFWPCGVTPQSSAESAALDLMITHAPAHAFITDLLADEHATG
ncbi:MAG TPA: DUF1445 domain-containing protein [Verrucomicrobiales bacterium]|nr:DUF1445 domain-containing protein [Verrucomicrobiales bacterium]